MLLFIRNASKRRSVHWRFNTSHVTLYLGRGMCRKVKTKFQYISCYSLSYVSQGGAINRIMFQYISCYSLSECLRCKYNRFFCFNTSHVTLYQCVSNFTENNSIVSIHLMLLFIPRFSNLFPANLLYNIAKHKGLQYFSQAA